MSAASSSEYQKAMSRIRDLLSSQSVKVGERLPSERALAADFNVGRPVVREVLRSLETLGVVEIRQGAGTYVSTPQASVLSDLFQLALSNQSDIVEIRAAIELHAARLACARASQSDYEMMAAALDRIVDSIRDAEQGGLADFEFHTAIVRASQSPSLLAIYLAISEVLKTSHFGRRERILKVEGIDEYLIDHHQRILHALVERDEERTVSLLSEHFKIGADFMRRAVLVGTKAHEKRG